MQVPEHDWSSSHASRQQRLRDTSKPGRCSLLGMLAEIRLRISDHVLRLMLNHQQFATLYPSL